MRLLLLNKPFHVLPQFTAADGRACLADFVDLPAVYPAGRLDYDSEGLMVLTDCGPWQARISEPSSKLRKRYLVQVEGEPTAEALARLRAGERILELQDELVRRQIEVHKVSAEDESLITQRPDLADASVKVTGDLDGTAFVFTSGVEEEFEFELSPPVDSSTGSINVTLSIDVESWFRADNGSLLDPSLEANRSEIETNIEQSFEAFEDDDGDGEDDAESAS